MPEILYFGNLQKSLPIDRASSLRVSLVGRARVIRPLEVIISVCGFVLSVIRT